MSVINGARQEQSAGIDRINQTISQTDPVTQQNAALVEEAAAASEAMQDRLSTQPLSSAFSRSLATTLTSLHCLHSKFFPKQKRAH